MEPTENSTHQYIVEIATEQDFNTLISTSQTLIMVDFWAERCGPCRILKPVLEQLSEEYMGKVILAKVNVDEPGNQNLAIKYEITSIPHVMFFKGGQKVNEFIGALPHDDIKKMIDQLISSQGPKENIK